MKIIINEEQFKKIISTINEKYIEDPYMYDNDIYHYNPTQSEIDDFNSFDDNLNRVDKTTSNEPLVISKNKKKFSGMAKIVFVYPNGIEEDVNNSYGPIAVVQSKLKKIKSQNTKDAPYYKIKYFYNENINEDIHPNEAYDDYDGLKTVVDGKRNIATVNFIEGNNSDKLVKLIGSNNLKLIKVDKNPFNLYIVYRDGFKEQALKLVDIANTNNGYLPADNPELSYLIGRLLGYYEEDVRDFVKKLKK